MFDSAGINGVLKKTLWTETIKTAVEWYNVSVRQEQDRYPELK